MKKTLLFLLLLLASNTLLFSQDFVTIWRTNIPGESISIPTAGAALGYNYDIDWEDDGVFDNFNIAGDISHNYPIAGLHRVRIRGTFPRIFFNNSGDKDKIFAVRNWGNQIWTSMRGAFHGCTNLQIIANDSPNLSNVTDMRKMFMDATSFNSNISSWDTSNIISMAHTFRGASSFNESLNKWDVSHVEDMSYMFCNASSFNKNLTNWDTSSVMNMSFMFFNAQNFNQEINNWSTSNVATMQNMFFNASSFNQDLGTWKTSSVTNMLGMFNNATAFNQNIGKWDVSNVANMANMFSNASSFNQKINSWNTAIVSNMSSMFSGATSFNQEINNWNTSNVLNMSAMFFEATSFNQDISNWNTSTVTTMRKMFVRASSFNQDISSWDTNNVISMEHMFNGATSFDYSIGNWDVSNVTNMSNMFNNVKLSTSNYDNMLQLWDVQSLQEGVYFNGGNSKYCEGKTARNNMIASNNWTIADGGSEGLNCTISDFGIALRNIGNKEVNGFKLHPNPAHDILFIEGLEKGNHIEVIDVTGKVMMISTTESAINGINISTLGSGIYFIKSPTNDSFLIKKLIKI